jgi:hypothetical protein
MKTTLVFPTYLHLAGFISVAENNHIDIDPHNRSLTADFNERDIQRATQMFAAQIKLATA